MDWGDWRVLSNYLDDPIHPDTLVLRNLLQRSALKGWLVYSDQQEAIYALT